MEIKLNSQQLRSILTRFNLKIRRKHKTIYNIEEGNLIKVCIHPCIYSNNENIKKDNLIIKYFYNKELLCLNIPLEEYKDLL